MIKQITLELCAGNIDDCLALIDSPIDRFELNSALELDGLTPTLHTLRTLRSHTDKPIMCMIRPHTAGFTYTEQEYRIMLADAAEMLENGADGIVFGFLGERHEIDRTRTAAFADLAHRYHAEAVFHKAFDLVQDPFSACETLITCGIDRVLTSGTAPDALTGSSVLQQLIQRYGTGIDILPGGGITSENVRTLIHNTGTNMIHFSAKSRVNEDGMYFRTDMRKADALFRELENL